MTLPMLVAGIVLELTSGWFPGQHTVGLILIIVSVVSMLLTLGALALVTGGRR